jgi:hypothetical protein
MFIGLFVNLFSELKFLFLYSTIKFWLLILYVGSNLFATTNCGTDSYLTSFYEGLKNILSYSIFYLWLASIASSSFWYTSSRISALPIFNIHILSNFFPLISLWNFIIMQFGFLSSLIIYFKGIFYFRVGNS